MSAKYSLSLDIVFVSIVAALSGFLFGYHIGIFTGALIFIAEQFQLTSFEQGMLVSIILVGGLVGALFGGLLSDYLGRKRTLFLTVLLILIATFFLYDAKDYRIIMFGRLITGLAIGIGSVTAPLYLAEIAPKAHRGSLVSLNQLMIVTGILVSFWVSYMLAADGDWRILFTIGLIPAALQLIGLFFIPESPDWLMGQGRKADAEKSLRRLEMDASFLETKRKQDLPTKKRLAALLDPSVRSALIVGIGISVLQQITGINTVFFYAPHIFKLAGFTSAKAAIYATTWVGIINVFMTVVGLWLIDRIGRRPLLLISLSGMALSLALLGSAFIFSAHGGALAIVSLMVYIASFAVGMGMIPWLMISEIFPLGIRGRAMGISIFSNWTANYLIALTFLPLIHALGIGQTYWLFMIICMAGIWFSWKKVPETRGKTFEEIQKFWHK
ncbi:MAG: transporter [Parachlamydiales bacterium]|nr:transporter [Parachlamydiales bacterium]